ncbi:MAG: hypothetical protein ACYCX5_12520 [Coriobacteriia bacterium]
MTIPKKGKKGKGFSDTDYGKLAKKLKGIVDFKVDLRKTDANPKIEKGKNTFNFGERMALFKAARALKEFGSSATFVPLPKKAKESKKAYKQRISNTRKDTGQRGTMFKGVFIDSPNFAKVNTKRIKTDKGWTTEIQTETIGKKVPLTVGYGREFTREKIIGIDRAEFTKNPKKYMQKLQRTYGKDWDYIMPLHSAWRGEGAQFNDKFFKKLANKINRWSYKYNNLTGIDKDDLKAAKSKQEHWLTGFVLVKYIVKPNKGAMI